MSKDKLVPALFGKLSFSKSCCSKKEDKIGNLSANVQVCGIIVIILATFVPFKYFDKLISSGALFLFSLTDCCLLTIRYKCPSESFLGNIGEIDDNASVFSIATVREQLSLGRILILLNVFSFASGLSYAYIPITALQYSLMALFAALAFSVTLYISFYCDEASSTRFALEGDGYGIGRQRFRTPFVPYLPSLGIFLNWFMVANVGWEGLVMLVVYLIAGVLVYGTCCSGKSVCTQNNDIGAFYESEHVFPGRASENLCESLLPEGDELEYEEPRNGIGIERKITKDVSEIEQTRKSII